MFRWLLVVVCLVVVGCGGVVEHVVWVVDGDTLVMSDDSRVRIADVDACEVDTECGVDALWLVVELVYDKDVRLVCDGVGLYGRRLCEVWTMDGVNVGDYLVGAGVAREWSE